MTEESKINLLKTLINQPGETPGENKSQFVNEGYSTTSVAYDSPLTFDQLQWNGYTIGLNGDLGASGGYVYLYDPEGELIFKKKAIYKDEECSVISIDIDENGDLYGLFVYNNSIHLAYFYNPFMQTPDGVYDLTIKIAYSLQSNFQAMYNEIGVNGTVYNTDIKKSPIDSRFLITWAFGRTTYEYTLITALYTVNVGSDNTFEYRYKDIGTYTYNWIKNVKANWTDSNVEFSTLVMSCNYSTAVRGAEFYKVTGNFSNNSTMTATLLLSEDSYYFTEFTYVNAFPTSKNAVQTNDSIYFVSCHADTSLGTIKTTLYRYKNSLSTLWEKTGRYDTVGKTGRCNIVQVNNQVFAWALICVDNSVSPTKKSCYCMHILDNTVNETAVYENDYWVVGFIGIIQNFFNLYKIYLKFTSSYQYTLLYTFKPDGYNGQSYFDSNSTISENMELYGLNNNVIFDRNLYDKRLIENIITSVTQVPYNYLNDVPIISEKLISKTNSVIDENSEEINKNRYEELIISNLDTIKVYDKNLGVEYNANSSIQVAKNLYNGFQSNYKMTKYRIYYENNYLDFPLENISISGNIATIEFYIYNTGIKSIEIYDDNFTTPFVTIDLSSYELNKLYKIIQKVKVE